MPEDTDTAKASTLGDPKPPLTHLSSIAQVRLATSVPQPRNRLATLLARLATLLARPYSPRLTLHAKA